MSSEPGQLEGCNDDFQINTSAAMPSMWRPIKPDGRQAVICCPSCQGSVIVPESLRQIPDHVRWPVVLFDSFQSNDHSWLKGTTSELFTPLTQRIHDGRYRWEAHCAHHK
jgi:hypothetical protein